jgi:hypothetical protein
MSSFTGWRVLVNFLLPPPMLLTFLLVLPFPRNVRKGLLLFTSKVLNFPVCKLLGHCSCRCSLQQLPAATALNLLLLLLHCSRWHQICAYGADPVWRAPSR